MLDSASKCPHQKISAFLERLQKSPKHKKKDLTLQELISHMRTEEGNRLKDKLASLSLNSSNANLIESFVPQNKDRFKGKNKKDQKAIQTPESFEVDKQKNSEAEDCLPHLWQTI